MGGPLPFPPPMSHAAAAAAVDVVGGPSTQISTTGTTQEDKNDPSQGAYRLAYELETYTKDGLEAVRSQGMMGMHQYPTINRMGESIADLQLKTARQLRQLLPTASSSSSSHPNNNTNNGSSSSGGDLLHLVQERNWIPILLRWLNIPERPAVQVEALLALTNIAELCASSYKYGGGGGSSSVPFPPLSFTQTLSAEALSAFHSSLSSTIQHHHQQHAAQQKQQLKQQSSSNNHNNKTASSSPGPVPPPTVPQSFPQHLTASSQHLLLRHADAIPTFISLLESDDPMVYEQALWILGSLVASSGDNNNNNDKARELVLGKGIWKPLLQCLEKHKRSTQIQRLGSWCLSNLSENMLQQSSSSSHNNNNHHSSNSRNNNNNNTPGSTTGKEEEELLILIEKWLQGTDPEILSYACWTLSHWCDGPSPQIASVVNNTRSTKSFVPRLVELLSHKVWRVTKPALRTIGNIVCAEGTDGDYTQVILEEQAVPKLTSLIQHSNREIQKEACWTLSNIAAGTVDQIQAVLEAGAIPPLVQLVSSEEDPEVRSEACWVVLNATSCGSDAQIDWLVQEGCVSVLGVLLEEVSMVMMALEGLERVLQVEESHCRLLFACNQDSSSTNNPNTTISPQPLVPALLIERALDGGQSSAVTKRASRIWNHHFVSCALCQRSFSKHFHETNFCEECKCHVCLGCNCQIYHLSYQEELWAATEETEHNNKNAQANGAKKKKKSRKAKKKEKKLQKEQEEAEAQKEEQQAQREEEERQLQQVIVEEEQEDVPKGTHSTANSSSSSKDDNDRRQKDGDIPPKERHPPVDFVSYLQQTNSIIALAKLMDALEYDEDENNEGNETSNLEANAPHISS